MALTTSRAKPPLAPSQQYDSLAKWVLDKRLWMLSVYTGAAVVLSTSLLALLTRYWISISMFINIPVFSFLMCISFLLPLILLRRWDLQPTYVPPASYSAQLSTLLNKPTTYRTIGIAAASFASYALLNCLCAASLGAHDWHLFAPTKRHALNLNEGVIMLMLGNALVGATLASKDLLTNRSVVKWPSKISLRTNSILYYATISFSIILPIFLALLVSMQFTIGYWVLRKAVYRTMMRLPILGVFVKPFIIQAARPSTPFKYSIIPRMIVLSVLTTIHYEHAQAFFDSIAGRGMLVARDSMDPDRCLRSGMEASEYYQHFAYLELAYVARKGPTPRRAPVFADPTKWHFISRSCLRLLGQHYGHLKRRGAPAPAPAAPQVAPPSALSVAFGSSQSHPFGMSTPGLRSASPAHNLQTPIKRAQLIPNVNSSVYKPVPPPSPGAQLLKSFLLSSTLSPTETNSSAGATPPGGGGGGGVADAPGAKGPAGGNMPAVFVMTAPEEKARLAAQKAGGAPPPPPPVPAPRPSLAGLVWKGVKWLIGQVTARVPGPPIRANGEPFVKTPPWVKSMRWWFRRERVGRKVNGLLVGREMDCLCSQILTGFTIASLKEDAHGTLQQDIPKILEALTRMLLALEDYTTELRTTAAKASPPEGIVVTGAESYETEIAIDEYIYPITKEITENLKDVMSTFGDRLNVFRLPGPIARRLQQIVREST